jgi:hypothetical protein
VPAEEHPNREADHVVVRLPLLGHLVEAARDVAVAVVAADVVHAALLDVAAAVDGGVPDLGGRAPRRGLAHRARVERQDAERAAKGEVVDADRLRPCKILDDATRVRDAEVADEREAPSETGERRPDERKGKAALHDVVRVRRRRAQARRADELRRFPARARAVAALRRSRDGVAPVALASRLLVTRGRPRALAELLHQLPRFLFLLRVLLVDFSAVVVCSSGRRCEAFAESRDSAGRRQSRRRRRNMMQNKVEGVEFVRGRCKGEWKSLSLYDNGSRTRVLTLSSLLHFLPPRARIAAW